VEDGSPNGRVQHSILSAGHSRDYSHSFETSSAGIGHEKHNTGVTRRGSYGVAGQDVYGHDHDSVFVADGHGPNGLQAALAGIEMRHVVSKYSAQDILKDVQTAEHNIRNSFVSLLEEANFPRSGATFVQMRLVSSGSRRFMVTVNIGDSEALLVYRDRVHQTSVAHSWDDLDVYRRYVMNCERPKNVCYNRWNASRHQLLDPDGEYRPMLIYDIEGDRVGINVRNLDWITNLYQRVHKPRIRYGTQGVRIPSNPHENWGSSVLLHGTARGQNMATYGDTVSRERASVPMDMVHVYIHEIPPKETVVAIVQSDGVSNRRTLIECGYVAWSSESATKYIQNITGARDDMSVGMLVSSPITE